MATIKQIEAVARIIMEADGYTYNGDDSLIVQSDRGNPRPQRWVALAREILKTVEKMRRKRRTGR